MKDYISENSIRLGHKCNELSLYGFNLSVFSVLALFIYYIAQVIVGEVEIFNKIIAILSCLFVVSVVIMCLYLVGHHFLCLGKIATNTDKENKLEDCYCKYTMESHQLKVLNGISVLVALVAFVSIFIPLVVYEKKVGDNGEIEKIVLNGIMAFYYLCKGGEGNYINAIGIISFIHILTTLCLIGVGLYRVSNEHKVKPPIISFIIVVICFLLNLFYMLSGVEMIKFLELMSDLGTLILGNKEIKVFSLHYLPMILSFIMTLIYLFYWHKYSKQVNSDCEEE